jgi:hypothetical protein
MQRVKKRDNCSSIRRYVFPSSFFLSGFSDFSSFYQADSLVAKRGRAKGPLVEHKGARMPDASKVSQALSNAYRSLTSSKKNFGSGKPQGFS